MNDTFNHGDTSLSSRGRGSSDNSLLLSKGCSNFFDDYGRLDFLLNDWLSDDFFLNYSSGFRSNEMSTLAFFMNHLLMLFMDYGFVHLMNELLMALMNDWLVNFTHLLLIDDGLMVFMNHRLMMLVHNVLVMFMNHILMVLVNDIPMHLFHDWGRGSRFNASSYSVRFYQCCCGVACNHSWFFMANDSSLALRNLNARLRLGYHFLYLNIVDHWHLSSGHYRHSLGGDYRNGLSSDAHDSLLRHACS